MLEYPPFKFCNTTGYYDDSPYNQEKLEGVDKEILEKDGLWGKPRHFFITMWLCIITDNILHLICNAIALYWIVNL